MTFRHCMWCGERYHEDDDWVDIGNGLIVCYECSLRDVADYWAAGNDDYDLAEESEWDDSAEQEDK